MSNQIDIDALERAALAATPGPWGHDGWMHVGAIQSDQLNGGYVIAECQGPSRSENMSHIAASNPATILELIRQLRNAHHQRDILLAPLKAMTSKGRIPPTSDIFHRARHAIEKVEGGAA